MAAAAFIGLGNMGGYMARNLVKAGHAVRGFDLSAAAAMMLKEFKLAQEAARLAATAMVS